MDENVKERSDELEPRPISLKEKIAFLSSSQAHAGETVEVRETHMAFVFLAGELAYKMKRPVRLPHLDYSTLAARGRTCGDEVILNRRLAKDVYLGKARLTSSDEGALSIDGEGKTVEWLVKMRRLPEDRMLSACISSGTVKVEQLDLVGSRLGAFYRRALPVAVEPGWYLDRFTRETSSSLEVFAEFDGTGSRGIAVAKAVEHLLQEEPELIGERAVRGRIIEGHGDLRPEHIFLEEPPQIIDCLEFSRELRLVDPFDELGFLGMECAVLGARRIGPFLIQRVAELLHDMPAARQLAFYVAYRATLRARQCLAHLLEPNPRTPKKWLPLAKRYLYEAEEAMSALSSRRPLLWLQPQSSPILQLEGQRDVARGRAQTASMRLFALAQARSLGKTVACSLGCDLSIHEERAFEDGEHKIRALTEVRESDVYVLQALAGSGDSSVNDNLMRLLFFLGACREHGAARVTALVPYLAYSRKDRQTKRNDPVSSRYTAQLFEAVGLDRLVTIDVHNLAAFQNAFRCQAVHLEARSLFVPRIQHLAGDLPVAVLSPDSGGVKRAEGLRRGYEEATGDSAVFGLLEKHRSGGKVTGDLFAGDVEGRAVFIFDDLISTGKTVLRAARASRKRGALMVVAMATHGLFGTGSEEMLRDSALDAVLVTNTLPSAERRAKDLPRDRLEILDIAPLLAGVIERLHLGEPISDLAGLDD